MQPSVFFLSLFAIAIGCSDASTPTVPGSCPAVGAACKRDLSVESRSGNCCADSNCVAGVCKGVSFTGDACTIDDDCQNGASCLIIASGGADAGSSGKVCVQTCTLKGQFQCDANDKVSLCNGQIRTVLPTTCMSCVVSTTSSFADYYSCNMNDVPHYAIAGSPCDPSTEAMLLPACSPDRKTTLTCRDNHWEVYVTCGGATPTCGHQLPGEGTCPTDSAKGCLGCIK